MWHFARSGDALHRIIVASDLAAQAPALANALAAEHVELMVDEPQMLFDRLRHAGSVFLGRHTPEAVGDYIAGPNHVLPTGRRARFAAAATSSGSPRIGVFTLSGQNFPAGQTIRFLSVQ